MNEARRQFALGVAGVRLWYARGSLPGAAPSPEFDFDELGQPETGSETSTVASVPAPASRRSSESSRQGLARLQSLLSDSSAKAGPPVDEAVAEFDRPGEVHKSEELKEAVRPGESTHEVAPEAVDEARALAGQAVGFHWRFWMGEQWLLVSSCSDAASRTLEDRLAGNILRALGDSVTRIEAIKWPVFSNPTVPGNDAAGAADVLSALAADLQAPRQLWLGVEPEGVAPEVEAVWREVRAPLGVATVSFPGSLAALSSEPASKRALWEALRPHRDL